MLKYTGRRAVAAVVSLVVLISAACKPELVPVATPVFGPEPGEYSGAQTVVISSDTTGASIRYTLDGSTPSEVYGAEYTGVPLHITSTTVLKAVAYLDGYFASAVAEGGYTIDGTVATPVMDPEGGSYAVTQQVAITTDTDGAAIRYTTDGSEPTAVYGTLYTGVPVVVDRTLTIRAVAYDDTGLSMVVQADYTINGQVSTPQLSPGPGSFASAQNVAITVSTPGASIRYTTDGSTPTSTYGSVYSGAPVNVATTAVLRAVAYKTGYLDSAITEGTYTIEGTAATPTLSPGGGAYSVTQYVALSTVTAGAEIRYTIDGTTPTPVYGTLYAGVPITVNRDMTLKAVAFTVETGASMVASASYTINGRVATPAMVPGAGTYALPQTVTVTTTTPGATIRYTTDGSTPTPTDGILYTVPVVISGSVTVRAIAYLSGWTDSAVGAAAYVIPGKVATPVATPAAGTYATPQMLTITTATDGATIRYTLDGTQPSATYGTLYTGPVNVTNTSSLRAIAYNNQWLDSNILTAAFGIALDSTGNVGQYTSLVMDASTIFVVYHDVTNLNLKQAFSLDSGANWPVENIDTVGSVGQYASASLASGDLYVSYYDSLAANLDLRFASSTDGGATWNRTLIDATGNVGQYTSTAVDGSLVAISYYDLTNTNAKVARSVDGGATWVLSTIADPAASVGQHTALAAGGGNLYLAYYDTTNGDLKFAFHDGTAWSVPVAVDAGGNVGQYASIVLDGSTIRIAYYDVTNADLKVVASTAADGSTWGVPETVDAAGYTGLYPSLKVDGGKIYVAYFEDLNYNLRLAVYDGAWTTQVVDSNGVGQYASLGVVGSTIAISYYDLVNQDLKLALSTDDGVSWSFY